MHKTSENNSKKGRRCGCGSGKLQITWSRSSLNQASAKFLNKLPLKLSYNLVKAIKLGINLRLYSKCSQE